MSDTRDWNAEAIDDLGTEVARLEADRDQWKARAEAAEAKAAMWEKRAVERAFALVDVHLAAMKGETK